MATPLRILLLEDVAMDAELVEYELGRARVSCSIHRVNNRDGFVAALPEFRPDLILSDYSLPQFDGMRALELARAWSPTVPFIIVTGSINEETAVQCMKAGATDYLLKSNLARIGPAVHSALDREHERGERARAEAALRRSEADLRAIFDNTAQGLVLLDRDGRIRLYNAAAARAEETAGARLRVGARCDELKLAHAEGLARALGGERATMETVVLDPDRGEATFEVAYAPVRDSGEGVIGVCLSATDMTERRRVDEHLRRAERMQATGRLAGGVAHEVNNMMTAILGFGDFVLRSLDESDARARDIEEIIKAARRAADVTRQLLAFSRQQVMQPRTIDINRVVLDVLPMLQRSVTEGHELVARLSADACCAHADPGQMEQVLLNLILNARDAMPEGGRVTIETAITEFGDSHRAAHPGVALPDGEFVMVAVSDTGAGMDQRTLSRIFEPFFTTKPVGQGTGLGLSTAYGIVKQTEGFIFAYSEPGTGTVFKVYIPRSTSEPDRISGPWQAPVAGGSEKILLVEDEDVVRHLAVRTLQEYGYTVVEAANGNEALEQFGNGAGDIDLVITDVAMPGMGGRELASRLRELAPSLPVLFMSGYTGDDVVERGLLPPGSTFLAKPFSPDAIAARVRRLLERVSAATPPES